MVGGMAYVMGPSGAGKDTLLSAARPRLAGEPVLFAHRYITRAPGSDENFVSLAAAEFSLRKKLGLFAMAWSAHGTDYGIGREIELWRDAGCLVVVSGSRAHFEAELAESADVTPILITASPTVIAQRLRARAREDEAAIEERIARGAAFHIGHPRLVRIVNDGPVEAGAEELVAALRRLRQAGPAARAAAR